ncbi:MAG: nitrogenase component 1 [Cyanobacteriota bacterium]
MTLTKTEYSWKKLSELYTLTPEPDTSQASEMFPGFEGLWCKLIMSVTAFATTENSVALIYGPLNCNWAIRNFKTTDYALYYGNAFLHMPTINMDQNIIVLGGLNKLIKGIIEVDKHYKPDIIGIFDSCAPALIGEDILTAIQKAQPECKARLKYFPSAGLAAPWLGKSIESISSEYIDLMEKLPIEPDTVNILGQYKEKFCTLAHQKKCNFHDYLDEATELTKYIEALGLKLHRVMISGGHKYIKTASQASINTISCPTWGYPLALKMQEKFETPYCRHSIPMGFNATKKWILELARLTKKTRIAEDFIDKEYLKLEPLLKTVKTKVKGKIGLIECGRNTQTSFARAMALGRMLEELGIKPYFFNSHPLEIKAKKHDVDYFLYDDFNPHILFGSYPYQKPVSIMYIVNNLNLSEKDFIYFTEDVFPFEKAGSLDLSCSAKVETGVHLRRIKGATSRGMGFTGTESILKQILYSITTSERKSKPTLYARLNGRFYDFENENNRIK